MSKPRHTVSMHDKGTDTSIVSNFRRMDDHGRILIPQWLRRSLGITRATLLVVVQRGDEIVVTKVKGVPPDDALPSILHIAEELRTNSLSSQDTVSLDVARRAAAGIVVVIERELEQRRTK